MQSTVEPSAAGRRPPHTRSFSDIVKGPSATFNPKPSSQFRGKPAVSFSDEDIQRYSEPFHFTLIGKFSTGRPPMDSLRKSFQSIGFSSSFSLGLIDSRHILIRFDQQEDYLRCWKRGFWSFDGSVMRIIKWHPNFSVDAESPLVPVWINLPLLPIHLYNKEALFSIARLIGEPLKIDAATESLSRPSQARVCIELDLMKERCEEVYITLGSFSYWQKIDYENIPQYCSVCHKIGHNKEYCRKNENRKQGISSHPAATKNQEIQKGQPRQEYRPINKDSTLPAALPEIQSEKSKPEDAPLAVSEAEPVPKAVPADPLEASKKDTPISSAANLQEDLIIPPIPDPTMLENSVPQLNTTISEDLKDLSPLREHFPTAEAPIPAATSGSSSQPDANLENEAQLSSTEDVLELGEIPQSQPLYASDPEVLPVQETEHLQQDSIKLQKPSHDIPSSSNALENRGKNKKKTQVPQDRIPTRQSSRGLSQSFS